MSPYSFALGKTPAALYRVIDCIQPARYTEALAEGRFTLVEMVAHLADMEEIFLDRMILARDKPGSPTQAVDESQRAIEKHYSTRDIHHELEVFDNRRRDTMDFLEALKPEDWKRTVVHSALGEMTIEEQVSFLLGHDLYHLEQAAQYLR